MSKLAILLTVFWLPAIAVLFTGISKWWAFGLFVAPVVILVALYLLVAFGPKGMG